MNYGEDYIKRIEDIHLFLGYMIDNHGEIIGLKVDKPIAQRSYEYQHDYVYFCVTKMTRSLVAATKLFENAFREDIMTICRGVYESYLLMGNAINHRDFYYKAINISVGLKNGFYKYKEVNGKKNYNKVIEVSTNKEYSFNMGISYLAGNTYSRIDRNIHKNLYRYISEYCHGDFIGAGNYRNEDSTNYDLIPNGLNLDSLFIIYYCTYLAVEALKIYYDRYDSEEDDLVFEELIEFSSLIKLLRNDLTQIIGMLEYPERDKHLKTQLLNRVSETFA